MRVAGAARHNQQLGWGNLSRRVATATALVAMAAGMAACSKSSASEAQVGVGSAAPAPDAEAGVGNPAAAPPPTQAPQETFNRNFFCRSEQTPKKGGKLVVKVVVSQGEAPKASRISLMGTNNDGAPALLLADKPFKTGESITYTLRADDASFLPLRVGIVDDAYANGLHADQPGWLDGGVEMAAYGTPGPNAVECDVNK